MRSTSLFLTSLTFFVVAFCAFAEEGKPGKGALVNIDGLSARVPADWKQEPPANRMRFAQFVLPAKKGDKDNASLVIFKGFGGSSKANIDRWKVQFENAKSKEETMTVQGRKAHYLDISGTYLFKAQPFNPRAKTERKKAYRMLAVHFDGKNEIYHLKLTGPAKTVDAYKKGFDEWLKSLK